MGHTLKDLAEMAAEKEGELAYGSETILCGGFYNQFGMPIHTAIDEGEDTPIDDDTYNAWVTAYERMEKFEANGIDYEGADLF